MRRIAIVIGALLLLASVATAGAFASLGASPARSTSLLAAQPLVKAKQDVRREDRRADRRPNHREDRRANRREDRRADRGKHEAHHRGHHRGGDDAGHSGHDD